jgi:hypothetical protein
MQGILSSDDVRNDYLKRSGIEGTISQAEGRGTWRRSGCRELDKTHLQEVATATAINIVRAVSFLNQELPAKTRVQGLQGLQID